jgi:hypothetical protein|tara:strand:- start:7120 stop:7845 length:726 start_codon:yes stop_codon:yes gene_type:complete
MAKIATYELDTNVVAADKWIGSDSQNSWQTKNFTAGDVADFINKKAIQSQLLRYTYQNEGARRDATVSFDPYGADQVLFSSISSFTLSNFDAYSLNSNPPVDISTLYKSPFTGSEVLMTQCNDMSQWAIFMWDSQEANLGDNNFSNIFLTYKAGKGSIDVGQDYFISLLTYQVGETVDKNFVYTQNVASATWVVTHNLNKFPSVSVVDSANTLVNGQVEYNSINEVTISFRAAFTGKAFFN